jgi:hypothetical protein
MATRDNGIPFDYFFLSNESLIPRARNYCCDAFLRSSFTHLLFIDADTGFSAQDVLQMLALMTDDSPYDVLAVPCPKKAISWTMVRRAVEKGLAYPDANVPAQYAGNFVRRCGLSSAEALRKPWHR